MTYKTQTTKWLTKIYFINNYSKYEWIIYTNEKAEIGRMDLRKKTQSKYMLSRNNTPQLKRHEQVVSKRMEKDIPCTQYPKDIWSDYINIIQNRQKTKSVIRDKKGTFYDE